MDLKATLETRTSKEGNEYKCIIIQLPEGYEKRVYLDSAELKLLEVAEKLNNPYNFQ